MSSTPGPRTREALRLYRPAIKNVDPGLRVRVVVGAAADFPTKRAFAHCTVYPDADGVYTITVAPDFEAQPIERIAALLAHELAHALILSAGHVEHSERETDGVAERIFGIRIFYDADDVQTLTGGVRPRPDYLPR